MKKETNCLVCGKTIYYFRNKKKYCSEECRNIRDNNVRRKIKDRPVIVFCKKCNKEIIVKKVGIIPNFCSNICRNEYNYYRNPQKKINYQKDYYSKNRDEIIKKTSPKNKKWKEENRERVNELMRENRKKNILKCNSRDVTWDVINFKKIRKTDKEKEVKIEKSCKICGSKENLQIHHEIYPTMREEIRKAINEGKIYFVCPIHHKEKERSKKLLCRAQ